MATHNLSACAARFSFQLQRAVDFLQRVAPCVPEEDSEPLRQYLYQSTILMLHSHFEEYLRCIVALATFYKAPAVRGHLAEGQPDPDRFAVMSAAELMKTAQNRVSFENGARTLKRLFVVLTGGSPFADDIAEEKCLDFASVRNIITHAGGWPTEDHAPNVRSANVIVESTQVHGSKFYRLQISRDFFAEALTSLQRSIAAIESRLASDPDLT
jgi:hypothetical protein